MYGMEHLTFFLLLVITLVINVFYFYSVSPDDPGPEKKIQAHKVCLMLTSILFLAALGAFLLYRVNL